MNIDIDLLKTFLEVSQTKHFGKAADNLYVTQSTVSARIKQLENALGDPVFTRSRNDIQLTPTGRRFVKYAESMITTWNRAQQELALPDENKSILSVGGLPSLWDIVLQKWLQHTYDHFHNLVLNLEVVSLDGVARSLQDASLDMAFIFESPVLPNIVSTEIMEIPLVMVSGKPYKTVNEAVAKNYIYVDWGTSFSVIHATHFGDNISANMHTTLGRLARDFIIEHGGTCYLAKPMVNEMLQNETLFLVPNAPVITRDAYALYPANSEKRSIIEDVLKYFEEVRSD